MEAAESALDALYLHRERGQLVCSACGQIRSATGVHQVSGAIADYIVVRATRPSIGSIKPRLGHIINYLEATDQRAIGCDAIDDDWIDSFRKWALGVPIVSANGKVRDRAPGTVEASVRQLAAVINHAHARKEILHSAGFSALGPRAVSRTPTYRADIDTLADMFRYALQLNMKTQRPFASRASLLRFLRISVATWCRPDAAHDASTDPKRNQWLSGVRVLNLNPKGRTQTRKYRPAVPIGDRMAALLDTCDGRYVGVSSIKQAMDTMLDTLRLPRGGETGMKLIRRSMATLARRSLGEEYWAQGEIMLGHRKTSTSDVYALFEPGQLGRALAVTNQIIEKIEQSVPGAFAGPAPGDQPCRARGTTLSYCKQER